MQKIGLFGGAFDPIHKGHIHIAQLAKKELNLDKVIFIPLYQAVHKAQPQLSIAERLAKIQQNIAPFPGFELSSDEIERQGNSYSIDTVQHFMAKHSADLSQLELYYIIGTDAFELFFTWREPYRLLDLVKFIVVARPGYDFATIEKMFTKPEHQRYLDRVFFIDDEGIDISSTMIRERNNANNY